MKPRLLINIHYLDIGGAEMVLIGLLQALDPARVDVDLFINEHRGEMMAYIPEWVNVLPERKAYTLVENSIKRAVMSGYLHIAAARIWARVRYERYARKKNTTDKSVLYDFVNKYVTPFLPSLKRYGEYDLAIACLPPYSIILDKVRAKKKMCWIHTDYTQIDVCRELSLPVWSRYDYAMSISADVTRTYCSIFPEMRDKIVEIGNIISSEFVRRRAGESVPTDMPKERNGYTLLTIGRYCHAKKLDEIPAICRRLIDKGLSVKWYIIGFGGSDEYIRSAIAEEGMESNVILLGKRENPYPYITACDWYIQPSRFEGKSIVVREAQILGRPVIITAYPTASSQVEDSVDGVIVPLEIEACADKMAQVLRDEDLKREITDYVSTHDYGNTGEVEKIYRIIGQ